MNVLVTGGAGFIGTNLVRRLVNEHCNVTILDNFSTQVHGNNKEIAEDLQGKVKVIVGSVTDRETFYQALEGQNAVVHLAAETGTGQSMYEVERYETVNVHGTAILMDYLVNNKKHEIRKVVVASSRAVYGEGKYNCSEHGIIYPDMRKSENMIKGIFEPLCPRCGKECAMVLTDESSKITPASFYGQTKYMEEQMALLFGKTLGISAFALRYQNVYGPGQSLSNPYTGILAIFANQAKANKPIYIFEDGEESRDFVYIDDVVEATWQCVRPETTGVEVFNVGSGVKTTVSEVVKHIIQFFDSQSLVSTTGAFREGDIRHNVADLSSIHEKLAFEPKWKFEDGIKKFLTWAATQQQNDTTKYEESLDEMRERGLMHG